MRFTPEYLDELKTRLRPSDVIGRYVKLKRQGNEWAGLSPFTKEKTPSFFVNDKKGFYHCFSSGKHGDIISFLQETQRMSFAEAVKRLAEDAGMTLPEETPQARERAKVAHTLGDACMAAGAFFQKMLVSPQGRDAAAYLDRRGVTRAQIDAFQIGFAPNDRSALKNALRTDGFSEETLIDAGLIIKPENGDQTYDRFRGRVMFPIAGPRERIIAFGGRALDPAARAKYLNSPETALFHKGSVLYNYENARRQSFDDDAPIIVAEGYMDVIAMWGAGVKRAVAPLGTAMTENQLALLWRTSDEPLLCFDGDRAGLGAAHRAIDRALPLLKPGKSLRFVFLPQGQDPDDLIRAEGRTGLDKYLGDARSLADVLWERECKPEMLETPERRASLRAHLRELVKSIEDRDVRDAYGREFADRLDGLFTRKKPQGEGGGSRSRGDYNRGHEQRGRRQGGYGQPPAPRPSASLKTQGPPSGWMREAVLVSAAIHHPGLLERQENAFLSLELSDQGLKSLLSAVLTALSHDPTLDSEALKSHLLETGASGPLERILNDSELTKYRFLRPDTALDDVEAAFTSTLSHHLYEWTLKNEVERSAAQIFSDGENGWKAAAAAREEIVNSSKSEADGSDDPEAPARFSSALEEWKNRVLNKFNGS